MAAPGTDYNALAALGRLEDLDRLLPAIEDPNHKDRFSIVQDVLKANNELIQQVQAKQELASRGSDDPLTKTALRECAQMIKELNDNLTKIYDIYSELAPSSESLN